MNKTMKKIISVLTFSVLFVSILSTPSFAISISGVQSHFSLLCFDADGDGIYDTDDKIRTPPSENTCPYVAMSLLLSFYDSYWNDNFVIDQYEWDNGIYNSTTDTLIETFAPISEAQSWQEYIAKLSLPLHTDTYPYYSSYAAENTDNYLEPYLISIGKALNFHTNPNETLGLSDLETLAVLQAYLYIYRGFNINQVTVHYLHESVGDIEAKMREIIDDGYPVIYIGKKVNSSSEKSTDNEGQTKSGHELIAYGIDQDNNIMLHTGWSGLEFCTYEGGSNPTEYNLSRAIIWLEINETVLTHKCSYNYVDSVTGEELCACEIYSTHPAHNNNHISVTSDNILYNNTHHWNNACHCRQPGPDSVVSLHDFSYVCTDNSSTNHLEDCVGCGYARYADHEYTIPASPTETSHSLKCVCGAVSSTTEEHYAYIYTSQGALLHNVYCECGYFIGTSTHSMRIVGKNNQCIHCGYVRSGSDLPGQLMSHEEDEEPTETE